MNIQTTHAAAQLADLDHDDAMILQTATTAVLLAAANGTIDLNALARTELASRGLDETGHWCGFPKAAAIWCA